MKRIISGLILIAITIFLIFYPSVYLFAVGTGIISVWGLCELYKNVSDMGCRPIWWLGIITTVFFVVASAFKTVSPQINEIIAILTSIVKHTSVK